MLLLYNSRNGAKTQRLKTSLVSFAALRRCVNYYRGNITS